VASVLRVRIYFLADLQFPVTGHSILSSYSKLEANILYKHIKKKTSETNTCM
jgi:hypothetical protein